MCCHLLLIFPFLVLSWYPLRFLSLCRWASVFFCDLVLPVGLTCPGCALLCAAVSVPQFRILGREAPEQLGTGTQPWSH